MSRVFKEKIKKLEAIYGKALGTLYKNVVDKAQPDYKGSGAILHILEKTRIEMTAWEDRNKTTNQDTSFTFVWDGEEQEADYNA